MNDYRKLKQQALRDSNNISHFYCCYKMIISIFLIFSLITAKITCFDHPAQFQRLEKLNSNYQQKAYRHQNKTQFNYNKILSLSQKIDKLQRQSQFLQKTFHSQKKQLNQKVNGLQQKTQLLQKNTLSQNNQLNQKVNGTSKAIQSLEKDTLSQNNQLNQTVNGLQQKTQLLQKNAFSQNNQLNQTVNGLQQKTQLLQKNAFSQNNQLNQTVNGLQQKTQLLQKNSLSQNNQLNQKVNGLQQKTQLLQKNSLSQNNQLNQTVNGLQQKTQLLQKNSLSQNNQLNQKVNGLQQKTQLLQKNSLSQNNQLNQTVNGLQQKTQLLQKNAFSQKNSLNQKLVVLQQQNQLLKKNILFENNQLNQKIKAAQKYALQIKLGSSFLLKKYALSINLNFQQNSQFKKDYKGDKQKHSIKKTSNQKRILYSPQQIPTNSLSYFQIKIQNTQASAISIGVLTHKKLIQSIDCGYCQGNQMLYIFCKDGNIYHSLNYKVFYGSIKTRFAKIKAGDIVSVFIDLKRDQLLWYVNNIYVGSKQIGENMLKQKLYPFILMEQPNDEIIIMT